MAPERSRGQWSAMARQQAAVARVGQLGLEGRAFDDLVTEALRDVSEVLPAPLVSVLAWNEDEAVFRIEAAISDGRMAPAEVLEGIAVGGGTSSLPGYTVLSGELVRSDDLQADTRFELHDASRGAPRGAALVAPIGWGARPWGVLGAWTGDPRRWSDDDVHFVQSMANTIGLALFRSRAEEANEQAVARLQLALQASGVGVFDWTSVDASIIVDVEAAAIFGRDPHEIEFTQDELLALVHPDDLEALLEEISVAIECRGHLNTRFRVRNDVRAEFRWCEIWAQLLGSERTTGKPIAEVDAAPDTGIRMIGVVNDITDQRRAEARMEALLIAEQHARRSAERARQRATLLADASELFSGTLASDEVVDSLTKFTVPAFCDGALTLLRDDDAVERPVAVAFDPALGPTFEELVERRMATGWSNSLINLEAVRTHGIGQLRTSFLDADLRAAAPDDHHLRLYQRLGFTSVISVPFRPRGRDLGVVSFMQTSRSDRHFDEDDLLFAQELADRAALAWDNARLFESRNRVLRSLQDALLPPTLPRIGSLQLTARYEVAGNDLDVGGDFYDVIELGDGSYGLVIGDVVGRGPDAAAVTGLVRHSVRTATVHTSDPARILEQTNTALLDQIGSSEFCTAAFLRVDLVDGERKKLTAASAGHPCPIVLRANGDAEVMACHGTLLGVVADPRYAEVTVDLEPGDAVILYTDGFTEARHGDRFFGEERLIETARRLAGADAEELANGLLEAVDEFATGHSDDRALLIARVPPTTTTN